MLLGPNREASPLYIDPSSINLLWYMYLLLKNVHLLILDVFGFINFLELEKENAIENLAL